MLRKETYADGGTDKADIPYSIQEASLQAIEDANQHCIFAVHPRESLTYHLERQVTDPRVQHRLVLDVDDFGNVLKCVDIAYGRRPGISTLEPADRAKQEMTVVSYIESDYTELIDSGPDYLLPKAFEKRQYELTGFLPPADGSPFPLSTFTADDFSPLKTLVEIPLEASSP